MDMQINLLLITLVLIFAWVKYKYFIAHKFKYRLYALRDKLRNSVIEGKIKKEWYFYHLDNVLSRQINELDTINIWAVIGIYLRHKNNKDINVFRSKIDAILVASPEYASLYAEYSKIIAQFFLRKHFITFLFLMLTSIPFIGSFLVASNYYQKLRASFKEKIEELIKLPEGDIACIAN